MKDWDKTFLDICELMAQNSTCARLKVGAVLTKDTRILSTGYNGVASGCTHCEDIVNEMYKQCGCNLSLQNFIESPGFKKFHYEFQQTNELHAEINCLLYAAKNGIKTDGGILYINWSPCIDCAKAIYAAGIKKVVYRNEYRIKDGLVYLYDKIEVIHRREQ